jgi:shikimate dehydrogenase
MHRNIRLYQVLGNPISHSLSPYIHQYFAQSLGVNLVYEKKLIQTLNLEFEDYVRSFFANHGRGLNITSPFKARAFTLAADTDIEARFSQTANTLTFIDDKIYAYNTDGFGLIQDLKTHQIDLDNKNILLLGAGGASRGVLFNLINEKPISITIANRSLDKAINMGLLAQNYTQKVIINTCTLPSLKSYAPSLPSFDIIINATSIGLSEENATFNLHEKYIHSKTFAYDMLYNKFSPFLAWAKQNYLANLDGLGMLINQAAKSFEIWHGMMPSVEGIYEDIQNNFMLE